MQIGRVQNIEAPRRRVQVLSVNMKKRIAHCKDSYGAEFSASWELGHGPLVLAPRPGEQWYVEKIYDIWQLDRRTSFQNPSLQLIEKEGDQVWYNPGGRIRIYDSEGRIGQVEPGTITKEMLDDDVSDDLRAGVEAAQVADDAARAAAEAAGMVGDKSTVLIQPEEPHHLYQLATTLWIDTTNGSNIPKRWNGEEWEEVESERIDQALDAADLAAQAALDAAGIAGDKSRVLVQTTTPAANYENDKTLWIDTTDNANTPKRWNGSEWETISDSAIDQAAALAQQAIDEASGKSTVLVQSNTPSGAYENDKTLWIDTGDGNVTKRWNGSQWVVTRDEAIQSAATAAANAASIAEGKSRVLIQPTTPAVSFRDEKTLWIDTGSGNIPKGWDGSQWVELSDEGIEAAAQAAADAFAEANDKSRVLIQSNTPGAQYQNVRTLWIDTGNGNVAKRWDGSSWVETQDSSIQAAAQAAQDASNLASGKSVVLFQSSTPSAQHENEKVLWIDTTDQKNLPKRWTGSTWQVISDAGIQEAADLAASTHASLRSYTRSMQDARDIHVVSGPAPISVASPNSPGGKALSLSGPGSGWFIDLRGKRPFDPNALYRLTVMMRVATPDPANKNWYIGFTGWAADGTTYVNNSGQNTTSNQHHLPSALPQDRSGEWVTLVGYARGHAEGNSPTGGSIATQPRPLYKDVRWIAPHIITDYNGGTGTVEVGEISIDIVPTEAYDAYDEAVKAWEKAQQAQDAATAAMTTAKGTITWSTATPSGTPVNEGSIWFRYNGNRVIGQWRWDGSTWAPELVDNAVIANLDAGKINAGFLDVANRIRARDITADKLEIGTPENILPNGMGEFNTVGGIWTVGTHTQSTDAPDGYSHAFWVPPGTLSIPSTNTMIEVDQESTYLVEGWFKADRPGSHLYVELRDQNGDHAADAQDLEETRYQWVGREGQSESLKVSPRETRRNLALTPVPTEWNEAWQTGSEATESELDDYVPDYLAEGQSLRRKRGTTDRATSVIGYYYGVGGLSEGTGADTIPVEEGQSFTVSVALATTYVNPRAQFFFTWYDSSEERIDPPAEGPNPGGFVAGSEFTTPRSFTAASREWFRLEEVATPPEGAVSLRIGVIVLTRGTAAATSGMEVWATAAMAGAEGEYFDGNTPDIVAPVTRYIVQDWEVPTVWTKRSFRVAFRQGVEKAKIGTIYYNHANGSVRTAAVGMLLRMQPYIGRSLDADHTSDHGIMKRRMSLRSDGLRLYESPAEEDGWGDPTISITSTGDDYVSITRDGDTVAGMDREGTVTGTTVSASDLLEVGGQDVLEVMDELASGGVTWGDNQATKGRSVVIGEIYSKRGVMELMDLSWDVVEGRTYMIYAHPLSVYIPNNSYCRFAVSHTTSTGSSSPPAPQWDGAKFSVGYFTTIRPRVSGGGNTTTMQSMGGTITWTATFTGTNRVLFFLEGWRVEGQPAADMVLYNSDWGGALRVNIFDMGIRDRVGNMSVNRTRIINGVGASPPKPPDPPAKKKYTTTWNAKAGKSYRSNGARLDSSTYNNRVAQAGAEFVPANGNMHGIWTFPSVTGTLSGATVNKVEIYIKNDHSRWSGGLTARVHRHSQTSPPKTLSRGSLTHVKNFKFNKGQGKWITLPSSVHAGLKSGSIRGFGLYTGTAADYGYFNRAAKLRITYTK